jgi:perosamine synthetase
VVRAGATAVLVDCEPHTWNINAWSIAFLTTPRTRAVMVVRTYGLPAGMGPALWCSRGGAAQV